MYLVSILETEKDNIELQDITAGECIYRDKAWPINRVLFN